MLLKTVLFLISAACLTTLGSGLEPQIPSVASFTPSHGAFELSSAVQIIVDSKHASHGTPSLLDFANTFRDDIKDIVPHLGLAPVSVSPNIADTTLGVPTIYLTLDASLQYKLYNGDATDEGYDVVITHNSVTIKSSAPLGVWWGTRTLLQQVAMQLPKGVPSVSLPAGNISDSPGWEVRGFMLDAGRHWYETTFLSEPHMCTFPVTNADYRSLIGDLCVYASFFKLNEIHLHASDNLWNPDFLYGDDNEGWKNLYAAFRFQPPAGSSLEGLVPRKNESWTKQEFLQMQSVCAQHGVTIIPEISTLR